MTIAACYLSSEGVVLGADSTTTFSFIDAASPNPQPITHHLNFAQKVFEIGEHGTLGTVTWGLGSLGDTSFRTLIARFADAIATTPARSVREAADRFAVELWTEYQIGLATDIQKFKALDAIPNRTPEQQEERDGLFNGLCGGLCLGGHILYDRTPQAMEIAYNPSLTTPTVTPLVSGRAAFWGCPALIQRLIFGIDGDIVDAILKSKKWGGSDQELIDIVTQKKLAQPSNLPLREAVDWIHTIIYTTIKGMKFSQHLPVCGGPIEIAVMSSDRNFRWVKHKRFDEALF